MKFTHRLLALLSSIVLLLAAAVTAQTVAPLIRVNVPFEFQVGNTVLPAGDYSVVRTDPYVLVLRDARNRVVATVVTTPAQLLVAPATPKVVFEMEGGRNVLSRVWAANSRFGFQFPSASRDSAVARNRSTSVQTTGGR